MLKEKLTPFPKKIWLASPTMHGEEKTYMDEAWETNWMSTVGANIEEVEKLIADKTGSPYAVALSSGTAALHLAVRRAGERLYGSAGASGKALTGHRVFCSDITFLATANAIVYEGGIPVFIDTEKDTWNMDPVALEKAFILYPDVRLVVLVHLYGTPAKCDEIRRICREHEAFLVEDAAESFGATYKGIQTGVIGDYGILSFNGNKIITGSSGGMFLTHREKDAVKIKKWATQSREAAAWYQHEEIGFNYRMSNVIAGVVRGQVPYLEEHIAGKRRLYERYRDGLAGLPVTMNPYDAAASTPNHWISCMIVDPAYMCHQVRSDKDAIYISENGKSCPTEILQALQSINAEGRPIWKPMHMQPVFRNNSFITRYGTGRGLSDAYITFSDVEDGLPDDIGMDLYDRGVCLPSDIKMTTEQQDRIIEAVRKCFE